jgi:hypothetical protein
VGGRRGVEINALGSDASQTWDRGILPLRIVLFGNLVVVLGNPVRYAQLARRH